MQPKPNLLPTNLAFPMKMMSHFIYNTFDYLFQAKAARWCITSLLMVVSCLSSFASGDPEETTSSVLAGTPAYVSGSALLQPGAIIITAYDPQNATSRKLKNIISFRVHEETPLYIPGNFTATIKVKIEYGPNAGSVNTIQEQLLTVDYNKGEGVKYKARNYFSFADADYVKVTVLEITAPAVGLFDPKTVLVLENEMRATRYYTLQPNSAPGFSAVEPTADEVKINWSWPATTGHTHTQLEWTWVEDELLDMYKSNGVLNDELLFSNNATRIDLPRTRLSYSIPLLYGGEGNVYYRIRPVNYTQDGARVDGVWSSRQQYAFTGHENSLNWQSTASYAEEGKRKVVVQYYDGSLRSRQTVTKENVNHTTVIAETMYDGQGRPAVQILPTPSLSTVIGYTANLNLFKGNSQLNLPDQQANEDPADFFDLQPANTSISITPQLSTATGSSQYYSVANIEKNTGVKQNIPDAEGYPYTVTRYTPDATGRIMAQSGVGATMKMGSGHETKYYYGTASQEELDGLFGTEVGNYSHYFKNMVKDANGQMSVSYVDMHGRTIATALAGDAPSNLKALTLDGVNYPSQSGSTIVRNLLNPATNIQKGNTIESINTLLVPAPTLHHFSYQLNPQSLQLPSSANTTLCFDCMYNLEISITDESGETDPIVRKFNNINIGADDNCNTNPQAFTNEATNTLSNLIEFDQTLAPGSYMIRKTLTLSESSLEMYKEDYLQKGMVKTEQQLIDSVYTVLHAITNCDAPWSGTTCSKCLSDLGTESTFRTLFLASVGNPSPVSQELENEITAAFKAAKLNCDRLCNTTSQSLTSIREQMLQDMMPYTGQYARGTGSGSMFNIYDIFSTNNTAPPFYKRPWNEDTNQLDLFRTDAGNVDLSIHPDGTLMKLNSTTPDDFASQFTTSWANALLVYHPEYPQLKFAEDKLPGSYDWINTFNNTTTWVQAATNGYLFTDAASITDPFYAVAPAPFGNPKMTMAGWIGTDYRNGISMWQLAYGDAACKAILDPLQRGDCYKAAPKTPPYNNLTTTEKDQVWNVFRNLYATERNAQVNKYILDNRPLTDASLLVSQNYFLHFPADNNQLATQIGNQQAGYQTGSDWSWMPTVPGGPPNTTNLPNGSTTAQVYGSRCESYITQWRTVLLQCPTLNSLPAAAREQILNEITTGMVAVCKKGTDASNPYGASNVAPSTPNDGSARNFEAVINTVFAAHSIATTNLCNPFVIEFPKPYGKGPKFYTEMATVMDTCNCSRMAQLKVEAVAAGKNPADLTSFNEYLSSAYGDVLTPTLFNALNQNCAKLGTTTCRDSTTVITANCNEPLACNCYVESSTGNTCYIECVKRICDTVGSYFALPSPQPFPDFLKCGFTPVPKCATCAELSALTTEFKNLIPSSYSSGPYFTGSDLDDAQVDANIIYARFLNYRTGFQYSWIEYAKAASTAGCTLSNYQNNGGATQTAICRDTHVLTDPDGIIVLEDPCQKTRNMAVALGQQIYNQRKEALLADLEAAYRAKCMTVKDIEQFTVQYNNKEYQYTLYYYDMAGNLIKTVPPKGVRPNFTQPYTDAIEADKRNEVSTPALHELTTNYRYNSLNQVVAQNSPDAHTSYFWYDRLGRLAVSQNAQQALDNKYSYTLYDPLGRITEVGQKPKGSNEAMSQIVSQDDQRLKNWIVSMGGVREQITFTVYDLPYLYDPITYPNGALPTDLIEQRNLRSRVSYTATKALATDQDHYTASFYTYDIHGNVNVLLQDYKGVAEMASNNRFKRMTYDYDLISGKVNSVAYQPGKDDAFYHRYEYDAENRLTQVETSREAVYWERDAAYAFYKHGPLAQTTLGKLQVQKIDYAYTVQGWLKGVNPGASILAADNSACQRGTALDDLTVTSRTANTPVQYTAKQSITFDDGFETGPGDAMETVLDPNLAACIPTDGGNTGGTPYDEQWPVTRDAYSFNLNYYSGDYQPIGSTALGFVNVLQPLGTAAAQLYNGNIAAMSVNLAKQDRTLVYNYHYDQLNRLVNMDAYSGLTNTGFTPVHLDDYKEEVNYDPNGNIMTYKRNGTTAGSKPLAMDDLAYHYNPANNQLKQVSDNPAYNGNYTEDIDNQSNTENYTYDQVGNLKTDEAEGLTNITWSVYGKILSIVKGGNTVSYSYDAAGNRISKTAIGTTTVYVRDASGNVMSVYEKTTTVALSQVETDLYGGSRIGMVKGLTPMPVTVNLAAGYEAATVWVYTRGKKSFELSNHLGNVLVTVSDKKIGIDADGNGQVECYTADIGKSLDYYPFGQVMPDRAFGGAQYRYGFNGKESDNDVSDGAIAFEARIYESRLAKFFSVDPLSINYPNQSPYAYNRNSPISIIDWLGLGDKFFGDDGKLLYESKGKGTGMYVVSNEQFNSLKSQFKKNDKQLSDALMKIGTTAYATEDAAAVGWAKTGFYETINDPNFLERAARIFQIKAFGDQNVSDLYVLGNTVVGHKAAKPGEVVQEVDPNSSNLALNGKDILKYSHTEIEVVNDGLTHNVPGYSDPSRDATYSQETITVTYKWAFSGVVHTHQRGNFDFSVTPGDSFRGQAYAGDISFAMDGYTTYLVPTTYNFLYKVIKLNPDDVKGMYFKDVWEAQKYIRGVQKTIDIPIKR